jgi:hypothetical protein
MFGLQRKSRAEKVKEALLSAASYADGALRDTSLHDDLRSAADHGAVAMRRVRKDVGTSSLIVRLVDDKKLRKHMRAFLDDLDSAGDRIRGRKRHRVRNVLVLAGVASAVVAIPDVRKWVSSHVSTVDNGGSETVASAT